MIDHQGAVSKAAMGKEGNREESEYQGTTRWSDNRLALAPFLAETGRSELRDSRHPASGKCIFQDWNHEAIFRAVRGTLAGQNAIDLQHLHLVAAQRHVYAI